MKELLIEKDVPLKNYSAIKLGGPARYFLAADSSEQVVAAIEWARSKALRFYLLGLGANTIFSDSGFEGVVILQRNQDYRINSEEVWVEGGVLVADLIELALANNLLGLEQFAGIPSTVGGATFINLHYYDSLFSNFLESADIYDCQAGAVVPVDNKWFAFRYEYSKLQERLSLPQFTRKAVTTDDQKKATVPAFVLLSCSLALRAGQARDCKIATATAQQIIDTRQRKYPEDPSVGCIFQNLDRVTDKCSADNIAAAYYIDQCGLKGLRVGGIEVSQMHANMFINPKGEGSCQDLVELIAIVKERVFQQFGIELREEVQIVE